MLWQRVLANRLALGRLMSVERDRVVGLQSLPDAAC
jgi:hypothetical protein